MALPLHTTPEYQPGAYLTDGTQLFEIIDQKPGMLAVENCMTGGVSTVATVYVNHPPWRLVQAAPAVPNTPQENQ